jgi:hypothetical protein
VRGLVRRLAAVLALLCAAHAATGQPRAAGEKKPPDERVTGWRSDLDAWLAALKKEHWVWKKAPLPAALRDGASRFKRDVGGWSDERALAELMRLAALAGDGHTYVLPFGAARVTSHVVPLRFYQFADGLFVIDAEPAVERFIGARVVSLAGVDAEELMRRIRPYVARDNDEGIVWAGPFLLRFVGYLEAVSGRRLAGKIPATLKGRDGQESAVDLDPVPVPRMRGVPKLISSRVPGAPPPPLYLREVEKTFWLRPIGDALYVQFNQVMDASDESLSAFAARLDAEIGKRSPRVLVVDVRHNNGGNLGLLDPLIAVLSRFTSGERPGRLVVLCGRNTFSAAQVFLARAEHEARAQIAGEQSSSKPNFVGEENPVVLPWSGAMASISNRYHETIPGDQRQWIEPQPLLVLGSTDYFANADPLLDAVLASDR